MPQGQVSRIEKSDQRTAIFFFPSFLPFRISFLAWGASRMLGFILCQDYIILSEFLTETNYICQYRLSDSVWEDINPSRSGYAHRKPLDFLTAQAQRARRAKPRSLRLTPGLLRRQTDRHTDRLADGWLQTRVLCVTSVAVISGLIGLDSTHSHEHFLVRVWSNIDKCWTREETTHSS